MARTSWSTSNYLHITSGLLTAAPLTMACWAFDPLPASAQSLMCISNNASLTNRDLFRLGESASGTVRISAAVADAAAVTQCFTSTVVPSSTWFHACGVWASASDRRSFLNGGGKGTSATSVTPSGVNRTSLGMSENTTINSVFSGTGAIAHAAIWNIALTDAEVLALANGLHPTRMHPESLVAYWPLFGEASPEQNIKSNAGAMVMVGTLTKYATAPAAPRIYMPKHRRVAA
jgi:hypothetical protein